MNFIFAIVACFTLHFKLLVVIDVGMLVLIITFDKK